MHVRYKLTDTQTLLTFVDGLTDILSFVSFKLRCVSVQSFAKINKVCISIAHFVCLFSLYRYIVCQKYNVRAFSLINKQDSSKHPHYR